MMDWEKVQLRSLTELITKGTTPSTYGFEFEKKGLNYVRAEGISKEGYVDTNTFLKINQDCQNKLKRSQLKENDILFSIAGMALGKTGIVKKEYLPANTNQAVAIIRTKNDKIVPKFLQYQFINPQFYARVNSISGQAAQPNINLEQIGNLEISLPPLPIQRRIASILSTYDDMIENNLRRIKLLEELAQRTYEEWFVKFRINDVALEIDEETGLPIGWEKRKLGEFVKTSSGGTPSRAKEELYFKGGTIAWIKTQELKDNLIINSLEKITEIALKQSSTKLFPPKTVLLAMYGNTIGQTAYLTISASTNQACCAFLTEEKEYLSYYLHLFLIKNKDLILSYRMGAAQENISQEIVKSIEILVPKEEILEQFGFVIETFYNQIENLTRQNRHLKATRDILLPRLMNGSIAVEG